MSTRCQIATVDRDGRLYPVKIYKHCDGYPEGVLPVLEPFAAEFHARRGFDPEYLIAQCLGRFAASDSTYGPGAPDRFTGWGLSTFWHPDIEYFYLVRGPEVEIYDPSFSRDERLPEDVLPNWKRYEPSRLEMA